MTSHPKDLSSEVFYVSDEQNEIKLENFEFEQSVEEEITPILDKVEEKPLVFNDFTEEIKIPIIEQAIPINVTILLFFNKK